MFESFDWTVLDYNKPLLSIIIWLLTAFWISFAGMLVWRLPVIFKVDFTDWTKGRKETTIMGRSHCDSCDRTLNAIDLIPVLGWIIRKGKCPSCHSKVSARWPIMEGVLGLVGVGIFFLPLSFETRTTLWVLFLWLALLSWMDDRTTWLPDAFSFPVLFSGLIFSPVGTPMDRAIGALACWLIMILAIGFVCWRRRSLEFMSWGDIILSAGCGAWLGWEYMSFFIFGAIVLGIIYAGFKKLLDKSTQYTEDNKMHVPFGPALSFSMFINVIIIQIFHISMF